TGRLSPGLATTLSAGTTTVSATVDGVRGTTVLTVRPAQVVSISISPLEPSVPVGARPQLLATAIYDDGTSLAVTQAATWTSSDPTVAEIGTGGIDRGRVLARAPGTALVTATFGGVSGTLMVTVTDAALVGIQVTPFAVSVPAGLFVQFRATGIYSDE